MTASTVDLLTKAQLAEMLGVSVPTINRWRVNGDGPPGFHLVGDGSSPVRFDRADVLAWLDERRRAGAYPPVAAPPRPRRRRVG